ncbi:GtrA family protein [Ramlibacter sp. AN1015]|uniref:GtrA family protein n=1 Tax=Ramlibacter sp. AN1015 TaxID=3133428 RepID=UPI0030BBB1EB
MTSPTMHGNTGALPPQVILTRYVLFAILAGLSNICAQELAIRMASVPVTVSILIGTCAGFFMKYVLDKRWIFMSRYEGQQAEIRMVTLYGLSSGGTALLFWSIELGAWRYWQTSTAKYVGAAVGLSIGNWIKYLLDKHFVFGRSA